GASRYKGRDPGDVFTGIGYAPAALTEEEATPPLAPSTDILDIPDWIWPDFEASLGADAKAICYELRQRAPIGLRCNLRAISREALIAELAASGIEATQSELSLSALEITQPIRNLSNLPQFKDGKFELQDPGSQALADMVPLHSGQSLLDYCAGGGGKSLAIAARVEGEFWAYDIASQRLKDLPLRAERAGVEIKIWDHNSRHMPTAFDTVLVDAPCSGTGAWRRSPDNRWRLTRENLQEIEALQSQIVESACQYVKPGGYLVYGTCSLLDVENSAKTQQFIGENSEFSLEKSKTWTPLDGCDGFYCAVLRRNKVK
ncbi:MAG: RsmB/NOP family class I SAM-dependent RNA methyltransferase, partial [Mangrovicoccus sp.]